jgi:hypothetical protein
MTQPTQQNIIEVAKHVVDGGAVAVVLAWVAGFAAPIATIMTVVWMVYRILDMRTTWKIKQKQLKDLGDEG